METAARYRTMGINYCLILSPSKASIYPEYLDLGLQVRETIIDTVCNYLGENAPGVNVINNKIPLLEAKNNGAPALYSKTDTHWNGLGQYYSCKYDLMRMNDFFNLGFTNYIEMTIGETEHLGDLFSFLSNDKIRMDFTTSYASLIDQKGKYLSAGDEYYDHIINLTIQGEGYDFVYENPEATGGTLLILTDSFVRSCAHYFGQNFKKVVIIGDGPTDELIDFVNPDIIVYAFTERLISGLY